MMKVPSIKWRQEFGSYLNSIPFYYAQPLNKALKRFGISVNVIPDHMDGSLPPPIIMQLKSLKQQSKKESNRWHIVIENSNDGTESTSTTNTNHNKSPYYDKNKSGTPSEDAKESSTSQLDKNVFDISRDHLLDRIQRMRTRVFTKESFSSEEAKHNIPISQMENFQDSLMKREVLRDVFEINDARKRPIFGNPYRNEKSPRVGANNIIDEAESDPARKQQKPSSSKQKNPLISGLFVSADELTPQGESKNVNFFFFLFFLFS